MSSVREIREALRHKQALCKRVTIPGTKVEILCRPVSLDAAVILGLFTFPQLRELAALMRRGGADLDNRAPEPNDKVETLRRVACHVALEPRVVRDDAAAPDDAILVQELDLDALLAIFNAAIVNAAPDLEDSAFEEFRGVHREPDGTAPGPDRATVQPAAVGAAADA